MERLVTQADLDKYPDLKGKGVSVNQHYNFPDEETDDGVNYEDAEWNSSDKVVTVKKEEDEDLIEPKTLLSKPKPIKKAAVKKEVAKKAVPQKLVPQKFVPKKVAPKKVAPKIVAPKKPTPKKKK